jgi:hypothetical protein
MRMSVRRLSTHAVTFAAAMLNITVRKMPPSSLYTMCTTGQKVLTLSLKLLNLEVTAGVIGVFGSKREGDLGVLGVLGSHVSGDTGVWGLTSIGDLGVVVNGDIAENLDRTELARLDL